MPQESFEHIYYQILLMGFDENVSRVLIKYSEEEEDKCIRQKEEYSETRISEFIMKHEVCSRKYINRAYNQGQ